MKRIIAAILILASLASLVACNGKESEGEVLPKEAKGSELEVCLSSEPSTLDPGLNSTVFESSLMSHLFSGLARWDMGSDGQLRIVADSCEELSEGVKNDDGSVTYTYKIREGLEWTDGSEVTAEDFAFSWQRAASTALFADYRNMFEIIKGYSQIWEKNEDGTYKDNSARLSVNAVDKYILEVTLVSDVPYWEELLAYPVYFPVKKSAVQNGAWATDADTFVSNGAYKLSSWAHNSTIVLEKNEKYHNADAVTMDRIVFHLTDDGERMLEKFEKGEWLFIDDVPVSRISELKKEYPEEFVVAGQIGTYYVNWNVNESILPEGLVLSDEDAEMACAEIRRAVGLLIDRNHIVEEITQAGELPASSFVAMGMTEPDGEQFFRNAGRNEGYPGYYSVSKADYSKSRESALDTLKKYYSWDGERFTDFPTVEYIYNTGDSNREIAEYLRDSLGALGIKVRLSSSERKEFLDTRKAGDYTLARNGWMADYNDPISFLDMWVSNSGNNHVQLGKGTHAYLGIYDLDLTPFGINITVRGGTWAETYDVLIEEIKKCPDETVRYSLMHLAEDMLMETGCITPLYFYTDIYMIKESVRGYYSNPLGFKYFMYCEAEGN